MTESLLDIRNLVVDYQIPGGNIHAVRDASLSLGEGEIVGIIGESGSGKSTLGTAIPRLLPTYATTRGSIRLDGTDVLQIDESRLNEIRGSVVTYVPQGALNALNPVFTVEHQIADPIRQHQRISWKEAISRSRDSLERVGVPRARSRQYPHQYSGGMRQRALIALSLALGAKLVILDEPTTALDVLVQKQVLDLVKEVRREFRTAFLVISHDLAMVSTICDKIAIMYAGEVMEVAGVKEIFENPRHPYTRALISSLPGLNFGETELQPISGSPPNLSQPPPGCVFHPRCGYAIEKCRHVRPRLEGVADEHLVACHRAGELEKWRTQ